MKIKLITPAAIAIALAGCSGNKEKEATADAGPVKREAGSWKTDIKLLKVVIPGMPAGMEAQMQKALPQGMEVCLTPEQAAKEDIAAEMSKGSQAGDCTFSKRDFAGGKLDVAGKCKTPQGEMDITMTGTVEPKKTDIVMNMKGKAPTGNGDMEMSMQMVSNNVGACKPS